MEINRRKLRSTAKLIDSDLCFIQAGHESQIIGRSHHDKISLATWHSCIIVIFGFLSYAWRGYEKALDADRYPRKCVQMCKLTLHKTEKTYW